jgi:hypothetical protein
MRNVKKNVVLILMLCPIFLLAQPQQKFSAEAYQEDLTYLREAINDIHPAAHRYYTEKTMDSLYQAFTANLPDSVYYLDIYKAVSKTVALVGCIHTTVQNVKFGALGKRVRAIPFGFWYNGEQVYLTKSDSLETGIALRSINGVPVERITRELMSYRAADGYVRTFREAYVSLNFNTLTLIYLGFPPKMTYRFADGSTYVVDFIAFEKAEAERAKEQSKKPKSKKEKSKPEIDLVTYPFETDSIAYLKIERFRKPYNKKFMRKAVRHLAAEKPAHLILDFRDNLGGSFLTGLKLAKHIVDSTINLELNIYKKPYGEHVSGVKFAMKKFTLFFNQIFGGAKHSRKKGNIRYRYNVKPSKRHQYDGELYILTNGLSASTTSLTASYLKEYADATVVGEETGGAAYGNSGSISMAFELPNSKLKVKLPLVWLDYQLRADEWGTGVVPDYEVEATIDDVLNGEDSQLDALVEMIKK